MYDYLFFLKAGRNLSNKSFFKGALILSVSGLVIKIIGALYRIPLARLLGGEGMALYQMAYPIYGILLALSTAGFPLAISILVAEKHAFGDYQGGRRVFRLSLGILSTLALIFTLFLVFSAEWLATNILDDPRVYYGLIAVSPAILLATISACFRGYFQGNQTMAPTALSQTFEQIVRVTTVLLLAYLLLPKGLEFSAAGAVFGAVTGSLASLVVLLIAWKKHKKTYATELNVFVQEQEPILEILKRIGILAIPVSIGGLVTPIMQTIDAALIPSRLQVAGHSKDMAMELFGQFSGMANTLINIAPVITVSISVALVPIISEAMAKNNRIMLNHRVNQALWGAFFIGFPASAGLWVLATPICDMLYELPEVGPLVAVLTPASLLFGLFQTTRAALQGMGKTYLPVINLTAGVAVKGTLNYTLVAIPALGIQGAGIATIISFSVAVLLNLYFVKKYTDFKMDWKKNVLLPGISTAFMVLVTGFSYELTFPFIGNTFAVLFAIMIGILSFSVAILATGGIKAQDLRIIPGVGPKLTIRLEKYKLFKS